MYKKALLGSFFLMFCLPTSSYANFTIPGLDFLAPGSSFECPVIDEFRLENVVDPALEGFQQILAMRDGCDKFNLLAHFVWNAENDGYWYDEETWGTDIPALTRQARFEIIRTLSEMRRLGGKKDNVEIINQANDFFEIYGYDDAYSFAAQYYLLAAVKRSVRPAGNDQRYTLMAIGEHPRQRQYLVQPVMEIENGEIVIREERTPNDQGPDRFSERMYNMSYLSFIERYDGRQLSANNRAKVETVKGWYNDAAVTYADSFLSIGDHLLSTNEPFAAVYWYTQLTRRPPITLANGNVDFTAYDTAVERIAQSYLVAAQNFAGVQPDIGFRQRRFENAFNTALWGLGSNWVRATNEDIGDWLGLGRPYDPNADEITRPDMVEMTFCSALAVAQNAQGDRLASQVSVNLRDLEFRLNQEKTGLERAIGQRISCR